MGLSERPLYHVVDIFGGSRQISKVWSKEGFGSTSYDIKLDRQHDLTTERGCKILISLLLRFLVWTLKVSDHAHICLHVYTCVRHWDYYGLYVCHICSATPRVPCCLVAFGCAHPFPCCSFFFRLFTDGLAVAGPPCSLYGPAAASVHRRTKANVLGNLDNFKVRLARRIWVNWEPRIEFDSILMHIVNLYKSI